MSSCYLCWEEVDALDTSDVSTWSHFSSIDFEKKKKQVIYDISKEVYECLFDELLHYINNFDEFSVAFAEKQIAKFSSFIDDLQIQVKTRVIRFKNYVTTLVQIYTIKITSSFLDPDYQDYDISEVYSTGHIPFFINNPAQNTTENFYRKIFGDTSNVSQIETLDMKYETIEGPFHVEWPYIFILYCFEKKHIRNVMFEGIL
jgi:hypothetical protein